MSVRLSKIYTKTGDDGTTGLVSGARVRKDSARVAAYGDVDELNSCLGLALIEAARNTTPYSARLHSILAPVQHDLFDLGADLATPMPPGEAPSAALRVVPSQTERLEHAIDELNTHLKPLNSFVLPGGTPLAAHLHMARTVARRAERAAVTLHALEPTQTSPETIRFLNRLSDLLFVAARVANHGGSTDVLWKPGANR
ncbi:MAG: cob(I)yrinic acid a,c-diamide adenosyltransferase [Planctomycetes bacterium]|nr:cob(I)yrinic acid a,c-diamide adenosyltransferase [Planctomycetota bacterium]